MPFLVYLGHNQWVIIYSITLPDGSDDKVESIPMTYNVARRVLKHYGNQ